MKSGIKIGVCILTLALAAIMSSCLPVASGPAQGQATSSPLASVASQPTIAPTASPSPSNAPSKAAAPSAAASATAKPSSSQVVYKNTKYGFLLVLPKDWKGYSVVTDQWEGNDIQTGKKTQSGPKLSIRNPKWTSAKPYQDIPILVLTTKQWDALQKEQFHIGAAPIGPSELGHNSAYVFALPARYNFAYPEGWKQVQDYLDQKPLQTFAPSGNG